jgi:pilus assembly protein CpaF
MSIRRFGGHRLSTESLIKNNTANREMLELLEACVRGKLNIMISGGTGAGKTTLLNIISNFIPEYERIVTIEDAAELHLQQEHVVRLETRPPNVEGKGAVKQRQLVVNSLRMRPDRIIIGEVRGEEAVDMLQAMNTGHEGSLTTIHANTPADAISRLETMVAMAELNLPDKAIRQQIASAINVIVQVSRMPDGTRRLMSITEITGMEGSNISLQNLFVYQRAGLDTNDMVCGKFAFTGVRPRFAEKLAANGIYLSPEILMDSNEKGDH